MKSRLNTFFLLLLLISFFPNCVYGGGPENLLLVVNVNSQDSLAVANHFIQLRKIPSANVIYLDGIESRIDIDMQDFQDKILKPVMLTIDKRKLGQQIDYIIYSAGFPTKVLNPDHVAKLKTAVGKNKGFDARLFPSGVSITSATYSYAEVVNNKPSYLGFNSNWYYRQSAKQFLKTPFAGKELETYKAALESYRQSDYETATKQLRALTKRHPGQQASRYALVRALVKSGNKDEAIKQLQACVKAGWSYPVLTRIDPNLNDLDGDPRFKALLETMPNQPFGLLPTRGFSNRLAWGPNGWPNGTLDQGKRFVLSTMLAVTPHDATTRGSTLPNAIAQLQRSVAADATFPKGTFYFTVSSDVRSTTRRDQFGNAIATLKRLGHRAIEIKGNLPGRRKDILGMTIGFAKPRLDRVGSRFVPGAICDNLTSFGGVMTASNGQTSVEHFLEYGAAGASGTVIEPFAIAPKFPNAMIHAHYAKGCTLAEAFYQSVAGPFQLLIVGDPLCRPWGKRPKFEIEGIEADEILNDIIPLRIIASEDSVPIGRYEIFVNGRLAAAIRSEQIETLNASSMLKSAKLSDGVHELRVVAIDDTLVGVRSSKTVRFQVNRNGHQVELELVAATKRKYQMGRNVSFKATATFGDKIVVFQNSRVVGQIEGRTGEILIDSKILGQGPISLRAVVMEGSMAVQSQAVEFEITP